MLQTEIYSLNDFDAAVLAASDALKKGKIVAFPTETVYGLGASIADEKAIAQIYRAKGRMPEKPLSVLVSSIGDAEKTVAELPKSARQLAEEFWPGPLTMILKKSSAISTLITAGKSTVGVRVPAHPAALEIVRRAGPLACPSANLSGRREPKTAADVLEDLDGKIDLLIDGGKTALQAPSTIIDLTATPPKILRRGGLDIEKIKECIGELQ